MSSNLAIGPWPDGADVAVSITFDVDAESGWLSEGPTYANRLTTLSEARFGVTRGMPRILEMLDRHSIPATFYVPGDTAERHRHELEPLKDSRHEIAHHGHLHLRSDKIEPDAQRTEIETGLDALQKVFGVRPRGYRSASWELTPETFDLLVDFGFDYDSSCMGDDRPYWEEYSGRQILELPVHWSLDDWPYFAWNIDTGGNLSGTQRIYDTWLAEFDSALADKRLITFTMHPEIIGRGHRATMLDDFLSTIENRGAVWFATHAEVVDHIHRS